MHADKYAGPSAMLGLTNWIISVQSGNKAFLLFLLSSPFPPPPPVCSASQSSFYTQRRTTASLRESNALKSA